MLNSLRLLGMLPCVDKPHQHAWSSWLAGAGGIPRCSSKGDRQPASAGEGPIFDQVGTQEQSPELIALATKTRAGGPALLSEPDYIVCFCTFEGMAFNVLAMTASCFCCDGRAVCAECNVSAVVPRPWRHFVIEQV